MRGRARIPQLLNKEATEATQICACEELATEQATLEEACPDIEDSFWEGLGEILTIKGNREEFAMNMQDIMQENMELEEGYLCEGTRLL